MNSLRAVQNTPQSKSGSATAARAGEAPAELKGIRFFAKVGVTFRVTKQAEATLKNLSPSDVLALGLTKFQSRSSHSLPHHAERDGYTGSIATSQRSSFPIPVVVNKLDQNALRVDLNGLVSGVLSTWDGKGRMTAQTSKAVP